MYHQATSLHSSNYEQIRQRLNDPNDLTITLRQGQSFIVLTAKWYTRYSVKNLMNSYNTTRPQICIGREDTTADQLGPIGMADYRLLRSEFPQALAQVSEEFPTSGQERSTIGCTIKASRGWEHYYPIVPGEWMAWRTTFPSVDDNTQGWSAVLPGSMTVTAAVLFPLPYTLEDDHPTHSRAGFVDLDFKHDEIDPESDF